MTFPTEIFITNTREYRAWRLKRWLLHNVIPSQVAFFTRSSESHNLQHHRLPVSTITILARHQRPDLQYTFSNCSTCHTNHSDYTTASSIKQTNPQHIQTVRYCLTQTPQFPPQHFSPSTRKRSTAKHHDVQVLQPVHR
jgi:hypothetical protein